MMRPYKFSIIGREGQVNNEYLIDLDQLIAIETPWFDTDNGIAYITLTFSGMGQLNCRFLTEYSCTDPSVSRPDGEPSIPEGEEIMRLTQDKFLQTVLELKDAWTKQPSVQSSPH